MNEFPIVLYLNQKYVFDIIAIVEDGFSSIQSIKSNDSSEIQREGKVKAEVGLTNVFTFLGVTMGGEAGNKKTLGASQEREFQKVHTPNSLFAKMRSVLLKKGLVRSKEFMKSTTGDFLEFKATLHKNPIIDSFEGLMAISRPFIGHENDKPLGKQPKPAQQNSTKKIMDQFDALIKQLKTEGSIDLIGEHVGEEEFKSVLTIDRDYLNDPSLSDIADGEFTIFGKVIRVLDENSNGVIDLLRKNSLGRLNDKFLNQFFLEFQNIGEYGLKNLDFSMEVKPPVIQVIPIAIFA